MQNVLILKFEHDAISYFISSLSMTFINLELE